jgi:hypothetical protein
MPSCGHRLRPLGHRGRAALRPRHGLDEERSKVRTATGLRIMARLRNLVITILRLSGAGQHRRRLAPPCPQAQSTTPNDHEALADLSAGACGETRARRLRPGAGMSCACHANERYSAATAPSRSGTALNGDSFPLMSVSS